MMRTYEFELIGGPLDGWNNFAWSWLDTPEGHEGERTGYLFFEGVRYQCNPEKTKAFFVGGRATPTLLNRLHEDSYDD